jgi:HprK-related kinase A
LIVDIATGGFYLRTGPFVTQVVTNVRELIAQIEFLYEGHEFSRRTDFADFHVAVTRPSGIRGWYRPQVRFFADGWSPFNPLPLDQAMPMFEWGLNWCVGSHPMPYLILHAAAVEKRGRTIIMPGAPGAGKSTLTAGLVSRGWRLLSDELTIISLTDGQLWGLARPVSLKNESIEVISAFAPGFSMTKPVADTAKGRVALLKAPEESIARVKEPARPTWIVFPRYLNGLPAEITRKSKADTMIQLTRNAFNYNIYGARAFDLLADMVERCGCYQFTYALLSEAVEIFDALDPPQ